MQEEIVPIATAAAITSSNGFAIFIFTNLMINGTNLNGSPDTVDNRIAHGVAYTIFFPVKPISERPADSVREEI